MIYLNDENFIAGAEVTHYGPAVLSNAVLTWTIFRADGTIFAQGHFPAKDFVFGINKSGTINQSLKTIAAPERLTVTLKVDAYENSWNIWVFPAENPPIAGQENIRVVQSFDDETREYLINGGKVLLTIKKGTVRPDRGGDVPVGFSSIFWNTQWTAFQQPPFTLGILCDPDHPALAEFPTARLS